MHGINRDEIKMKEKEREKEKSQMFVRFPFLKCEHHFSGCCAQWCDHWLFHMLDNSFCRHWFKIHMSNKIYTDCRFSKIVMCRCALLFCFLLFFGEKSHWHSFAFIKMALTHSLTYTQQTCMLKKKKITNIGEQLPSTEFDRIQLTVKHNRINLSYGSIRSYTVVRCARSRWKFMV